MLSTVQKKNIIIIKKMAVSVVHLSTLKDIGSPWETLAAKVFALLDGSQDHVRFYFSFFASRIILLLVLLLVHVLQVHPTYYYDVVATSVLQHRSARENVCQSIDRSWCARCVSAVARVCVRGCVFSVCSCLYDKSFSFFFFLGCIAPSPYVGHSARLDRLHLSVDAYWGR